MKRIMIIIAAAMLAAACNNAVEQRAQVKIETDKGDILVELLNETPLHRDNFIEQVENGTFDGILWHRVIDGFLAQTGDSTSRRAVPGAALGEGPVEDQMEENWIPAEFRAPQFFHRRGMLNAARQGDDFNPEKKSSMHQWTIITGKVYTDEELNRAQARITEWTNGQGVLTPEMREVYKTEGGAAHLDYSYTVFGQVLEGMEIVDAITKVATDSLDRPLEDIHIIKATLVQNYKEVK